MKARKQSRSKRIKVARKTKRSKSLLQVLFLKTNYVLRAAFAEGGK